MIFLMSGLIILLADLCIILLEIYVLKQDVLNSVFHKVDWYRVVLDEAHTIKSFRTLSAQAAFSLSSYCRWCLTGTPIQVFVHRII